MTLQVHWLKQTPVTPVTPKSVFLDPRYVAILTLLQGRK